MTAAAVPLGARPGGSAITGRVAAPIALAGRRATALARARYRLTIGGMLFLALIAMLALRVATLALFGEPPSRGRIAAAPERGDILDRNGVELARSFEAWSVSVAPKKVIGDPRRLAGQIAAILPERSERQVYADLVHRGTFRYVSRRVLPTEAKAINALGEPALTLEREPERLYPNLRLGAHVIGYTQSGETRAFGRYGMERVLDTGLAGGRTAPVRLAMDSRVQQSLESELAFAMAKHRAIGAAGLVLDVHTGEVVAMASLPAFNPNAPGRGGGTTAELINAQFNRTTNQVYELGSTFKALTIAMALDAGTVQSMQQKYDATRPIRIAGFTIHDDPGDELFRWATVPDIFIHSSNIGTARMAAEIGGERQRDYLRQLGFFEPVQVELFERARPLFPPVSNWGEVAVMTVGFGHGVAVSPLHLATAYAALVNGGILHPATMLKVAPGANVPGTRVFSEATSDKMRALLRLVVTSGTGRKANTPGYRVGGKTGTAEKSQGGRYAKHALVSTFAGAFPMDAPRYVVLAMLDEPHGTSDTGGRATAGMVAAPIVGKVVARIAPVLGIAPDVARDVDMRGVLGLAAPLEASE